MDKLIEQEICMIAFEKIKEIIYNGHNSRETRYSASYNGAPCTLKIFTNWSIENIYEDAKFFQLLGAMPNCAKFLGLIPIKEEEWNFGTPPAYIFVFERGMTVQELKSQGKLTDDLILKIASGVIKGIRMIQRWNMYCTFRLDNIQLRKDLTPFLTDLTPCLKIREIEKEVTSAFSVTKLLETPPEAVQVYRIDVDACDVWRFGVFLIHLTGDHPWKSLRSVDIVKKLVGHEKIDLSGRNLEIRKIIAMCLIENPTDRVSSKMLDLLIQSI